MAVQEPTQEQVRLERPSSKRPRPLKTLQTISSSQTGASSQVGSSLQIDFPAQSSSAPAGQQASGIPPAAVDPLVDGNPLMNANPLINANPLMLASDLSLPLEAVTETFAILAKRGSGKTYCASVLVEEMLKAGQTVVVADPVGVWWGLRSSADGQGAGLPIVILGGDHGDAPLLPEAGAAVADLAAEERYSLVLDLSQFTPPEQTRFMTAFAERLYRVNRLPLHLVLDEADQFTPQVPEAGQQPLLWAMNRIVRLGRARGLGVTLISQRPAVLAKNVLTQTEVLITLRLTSPQDRKAVEAWVSAHDDSGRRQEMLASLPSLPVGTAWLWSPGWLDLLQKIQVRRRETFDSSATPKVSREQSDTTRNGDTTQNGKGQGRMQPVALAPVDLDRLREKLAALAVASTNDAEPPELRRRVEVVKEIIQRVEVPVLAAGEAEQLQEAAAEMTAQAEALRADAGRLENLAQHMESMAQAIVLRLDQVLRLDRVAGQKPILPSETEAASAGSAAEPDAAEPAYGEPAIAALPSLLFSMGIKDEDAEKHVESTPKHEESTPGGEKMPLAERKVLMALAQYLDGRRKNQVALLTGYAVSGGGFNNALSSLRSKKWITGREVLKITEAGQTALGPGERLPAPGPALVEAWALRLPKADRLILQALAQVHPGSLTKERLGEVAGYEPTGGGFNNALSRLRTLALIEGRGELRATDALCLP